MLWLLTFNFPWTSVCCITLPVVSWPPQQKEAALLSTATPRPLTDPSDSSSGGLRSSSRSAAALSLPSASSSWPQTSLVRLKARLDISKDVADTRAGGDSPLWSGYLDRILVVLSFWRNFFPFLLQRKLDNYSNTVICPPRPRFVWDVCSRIRNYMLAKHD